MKKEQKTELTKERIFQAAMQEFGTRGYAATALNTICHEHNISKGLLYHNFKGKAELYCMCVERCFIAVTDYLQSQSFQDGLSEYMQARQQYFSENPLCARIFFEAVLQPPDELKEEISVLKRRFDKLNRQVYCKSLAEMKLRKGVTQEDALAYYEMMQEMFNGYFSSPAFADENFGTVIQEHEMKLVKIFDFMLYGIIERSKEQ